MIEELVSSYNNLVRKKTFMKGWLYKGFNQDFNRFLKTLCRLNLISYVESIKALNRAQDHLDRLLLD